MRVPAAWIMALGLVVSPAMAGTDGAKDKDKETPGATTKKEKKPVPTAKNGKDAAPSSPTMDAALEQLKVLLQAQTEELEAQRAALHEQQQRMAAMEAELHLARTSAVAAPATAAPDPETAKKVDAVAQEQEGLEKRLTNAEGKIKGFGPFSFSGDFRLRDEPYIGGPSNESQVRNRARFRLRFNVNAKLNDDVSGGFSLASGDINDPISTNQTTTQFYTRKVFALDRAFINYNPHYFKPLTLTGGKFAYNWYNTELTWDKDLNPEGLGQNVAWNWDSGFVRKIGLVGFELPFAEVAGVATNNKSIKQNVVYGGQLQGVWQFTNWLKVSTYGGFYNYHNADSIAFALATASLKNPQTPLVGTLPLGGNSVQNSIVTTTETFTATGQKVITNAQFASKFALFDTIGRFDVSTGHDRWPVIFQGDFVQNMRACGNENNILPAPANTSVAKFSQSTNAACNPHQRRGYWLEARLGRTTFPGQVVEKGDWDFAYTRILIEREAVQGAFNWSDLQQPSNVSEHRVEVFYQALKNVQFAFTGLFGRPLVTATSPGPAVNILKRLQFDVVYKF